MLDALNHAIERAEELIATLKAKGWDKEANTVQLLVDKLKEAKEHV